ncbi:MAG TPA: PP2C family serine/threonine-protein phosphatase [Pyrinomonadaceae bacterium]|nr:PP2C family serine/threonine-protein phosphatase [Pyrinomonadaceae bacterium]
MKEQSNNGIKLSAAVVSDRGLSKKRPLNEDSFLSDPERRIFAVADGVGGAQAGEVASQTAMEVLDEAFRHIEPGADVEDLLEIAIQRANSSIHSMSREHPKLSMMATTIVALHLDGHVATIGHVGDSRLYRLTPDGKLHRETADHSVVEEEVRAGRMTPEQASNHPSRNVISRALGAEDTVEVDLKTMEVEDGTCFLLCSDGITRHIPDAELRELLTEGSDLSAICEEMKRRCYERGAEDNLTAVIVRVGEPTVFASMDDERTLVTERTAPLDSALGGSTSQPGLSAAQLDGSLHDTVEMPSKTAPASSAAAPPQSEAPASSPAKEIVVPRAYESAPRPRSVFKSLLRAIAFLLLLGIVGAAAFYGGMFYQRQKQDAALAANAAANEPEPPPAPQPSTFEQGRARVDRDPQDWIDTVAKPRANQENKQPLDVDDPEFLYLYGRALFLNRDYAQSLKAFNNALGKLDQRPQAGTSPLRAEALFGKLAAAQKMQDFVESKNALNGLEAISVKKDVLPTSPGTARGR